MKEIKVEELNRLDEPIINRQIVRLFLEKLEILTEIERKEILKVIQLLNSPMFIK